MGRALDNAMLNVGLKDVAKGDYELQSIFLDGLRIVQLDSRTWASALKMSFPKSMMQPWGMVGWDGLPPAFSIA